MQGILGRIPPQVSAQTQQRIQRVAVVVLVVLLAHGLARLTWTLWPTPTTLPPTPTARGAGDGGTSTQDRDLARVASLHLFGEAGQQAQRQREAPVDAPETQLNLTLSGVLYNEDQAAARAIIAGARGPEKFYRVGDQLPGGATLDAIYRDRVILLRNGRHETLRLPEDRKGTAMESYTADNGRGGEPRVSTGGGQESLSDYRQQLLEDPAKIQQYLQGRPEMRNGEMVGFRVEPGSNPRMFQMTGLQPGDIVTAVGNVQIDSPDKGFQVFDELSSSDSVTLTVIRNGSTTQIPINFQN